MSHDSDTFDPDRTAEYPPVADYWTRTAVERLSKHVDRAVVGDFDPNVWFPWILKLVRQLMVCRPDPEDAWEWLTWRPYWFEPFSRYRLRKHREKVTEAIRTFSMKALPPAHYEDVANALFAAIDAGECDKPLVANLYRERS